jgi:hypothetical protein
MKSFVALLCLVLCVLCAAPVFAAPVVRRTVVRGPLGFRRTVVREQIVAPQAVILHRPAAILAPQVIVPQQQLVIPNYAVPSQAIIIR